MLNLREDVLMEFEESARAFLDGAREKHYIACAVRLAERLEQERGYRDKNRAHVNAKSLEWKNANRGKVRASDAAYREKNRSKRAAASKAYREANREKVLASKRAYRERMKANKHA